MVPSVMRIARFGLESHSRGWGESGWSHFPKTLLGMSPSNLASAVPEDCTSVRIPKPFLSLSIPSHAACHRACFLFLLACLHSKNKWPNKEEKELIAPSPQLTKRLMGEAEYHHLSVMVRHRGEAGFVCLLGFDF